MIDLHTHTLFSDGELLPSELVRRAEVIGYEAVALTDHADSSNLEWIVPRLVQVCGDLNAHWKIRVIPGIELTHVPPALIGALAQKARSLGARIVVVHGETPVEPVPPRTNRMAIEAGVDILAHPGFITEADAREAGRRGVTLELSGRGGHSLTNGHVAMTARKAGAAVIFGSDMHSTRDIMDRAMAERVLRGAGLSPEEVAAAFAHAAKIAGLAM